MFHAFANNIVYCYVYNRYYHQVLTNDNVKTYPYDLLLDGSTTEYFKTGLPDTLAANIVNGETRLIRYLTSDKSKYLYLVLIDTIAEQNKSQIELLTQLHNKYYADWFHLNIVNGKLTDQLEDASKEKEQLLSMIKYLQDKLDSNGIGY